jgi:diguanylate cyclase (GGDEF)-like protein
MKNSRTTYSAQQNHRRETDATDSRPERAAESRRTFPPPIASLVAAVIGLAVVLVQEAFGPEQFDLPVVAFVILSVGMLGFAFNALRRTRIHQPARQPEPHTTVFHLEPEDTIMRDDLTGLPNRHYFYDRLHGELELARNFRRHLALLVLSVDGLKVINDRYSHEVGDAILAHVAKRLPDSLRGSDVAARIGSDEFAVIMPATNRDGAFTVAERLQQDLQGPLVVNEGGVQVNLHLSLGVSGYPWSGDSVDAIVQRADTQMHAAKALHKHAPA